MDTVIRTEQLVKRYGNITAINGLSLRVVCGEIYAFLGLNGAGKTTTIRLLLGMVKPTSGEAHVLGVKIQAGLRHPWGSVGYLVETANAYPELSVRENLELMQRLRPGTNSKAVEEVIDMLGLSPYANRHAGKLSHGNAQRLGIAKALLHKPKLLILDEPANGLDPAGIVEMRKLLIRLARDEGVTVFMSSHILAEVSRMADRVGIIHEGRLLQELNVTELERNRLQRLIIRVRETQKAYMSLLDAGYTANIHPDGALEVKGRYAVEKPDDIATLLVQAGNPPTMLVVDREDLEDYFLRLIGMDGGAPSE